MDQKVAFADAVAEIDDFRGRAVEADSFVAVFAEDEWLAVFESDGPVRPDVLVCELHEGAVVEDVAILIDLDEGGALVMGGPIERREQVMHIDIE